ncbi:hypothetical protein SAMD00079811_25470 [Scytonema sp. HK-05]|uniref:hypothetical protein n=1 Tax=Scytonema sp. HK-05 TaxID=1137095 RepID=UPI000A7CEEB2|nr:hypothetical protein SAMD00079811_25470 [Scytonema sp. HK-05]
MTNRLPLAENEDELYQLSKEKLVGIIKTLRKNCVARRKFEIGQLNIITTTINRPA